MSTTQATKERMDTVSTVTLKFRSMVEQIGFNRGLPMVDDNLIFRRVEGRATYARGTTQKGAPSTCYLEAGGKKTQEIESTFRPSISLSARGLELVSSIVGFGGERERADAPECG